ncbi:hypothetical protein GCM10027085_43980 [Spirosoma aerophilum]
MLSLTGCTDQCKETRTFRRYSPVTFTVTQLRQGIQTEPARALTNPGKIYAKDQFLFINELKEGIHIIDNRNPAAPKPVAFVRIPGNGDIAIRNNILYADSYMDLVAFDISNPSAVQVVNRVPNVFPNGSFEGGWWSFDAGNQIVYDQKVSYVTETIDTNCEENVSPVNNWVMSVFFNAQASLSSDKSGSATTNGVAGSMARFALYNNYLYTVNQTAMQLFDIKNPAAPKLGNNVQLGWGIETIFPYNDKLFIGSQSGMHIYDNANPEKPTLLSVFEHARVCDPVVVHNDIAYVTLRSGNQCGGFTNQLDVVDVSNLLRPRLLKSYPMRNPHGLGVSYPNLFICEGAYGLKSFDIADVMNIDRNLLQHIENLNAYDVIPLEKSLLLIGKDGFYQFDTTNPRQLRQLSHIPISRPTYY